MFVFVVGIQLGIQIHEYKRLFHVFDGDDSNRSASLPTTAWYGLRCFVAQSKLDANLGKNADVLFLSLLLDGDVDDDESGLSLCGNVMSLQQRD